MKSKKKTLIIVIICALFMLTGCAKEAYLSKPLGDGFGFWDIFVYPMAGIMWCIGKTVGGANYAMTIIISTLIVRTMAWPIYAKSNDMQLKMRLVQPEVNKIQAKYAGKDDKESQQRMQMETMQLYKKYGIGIGGCITPFVQMPIFLGFYYVIRKIPACMEVSGHWLNIFTTTSIFGVDMLLDRNAGGNTQKWGVIILAILVGLTQIASLLLSNARQKKQKAEQNSDIPEYRRPQPTDQQKSSEMTMKIMMYVMAAMMVVFVLQSPAGLGLYWVIGNIYSTLQAWIGDKTSNRRLEKLRRKANVGKY